MRALILMQLPSILALFAVTYAGSDSSSDMAITSNKPTGAARETIELMVGWKHLKRDLPDAQRVDLEDREWTVVDLPHSYNVADGADGGRHYRGVAWYRKTIDIPARFNGKRIWIQFEGVSFTADVYIDGVLVGPQHQGGFSTFNYDATQLLNPGRHVIAVRVDNSRSLEERMPPQAGDYTKAGGIYREVRLIAVNPIHVALNEGTSDVNAGIASPGVYWTAVKSTRESAHIQARVVLENQSDEAKTVDVVGLLYNRSGAVCLQQKKRCILEPRASGVRVDVKATLEQPRHWNGRIDPYLYDSTVEVRDHYNGQLLDVVHQRVGFRSFSFDPERGFILNGQPYPLYGVNAHQDERGKGWARSDQDLRRDVDLILEMGATIVRTAHYPANQAFYDRADETGLIVYTELAINGTTTGGTVPEGDPFLRAARDQMRELICQNYNHPSIVLWGLYNEINSNQNSQKVIRNLQELTKDQERLLGDLATNDEPLRKTTAATWSGFDDLASITDTIGFNRYYGWYKAVPVDVGLANDIDKLRQGHPTACIGIAEYGGGGSVHQHEAWDPERFLDAPNDKKNVLWHSETRQAWIHEQWWKSIAPRNYLCYSLIWQMFDSAAINRNEGDRPGINDKGLVTDDRKVKKDAFYFYKANWNDPLRSWANRPTLHIVDGRWRQRTSNQVLVRAYSNLETPRLALNGKQLGEMTPVGMHTYQMELTLVPGDNTVEITAQFGPLERRDRVIWSYYPSDLGSVTLQEQPACAIKTKTSPSASVKDNPLTPGDVPPQIQLHRRSAL